MNLRIIVFFTLLLIASACRTIPALDSEKEYPDTGMVMRRIGDMRCRIMIDTDHYGIRETEMLDYDECRRYRMGMKVRIVIINGYLARIIGPAAR